MLSAVPVSTLTIAVSQEPTKANPTALAIRRNVADVGAEATVQALSKDRRDEGLARRRTGCGIVIPRRGFTEPNGPTRVGTP